MVILEVTLEVLENAKKVGEDASYKSILQQSKARSYFDVDAPTTGKNTAGGIPKTDAGKDNGTIPPPLLGRALTKKCNTEEHKEGEEPAEWWHLLRGSVNANWRCN